MVTSQHGMLMSAKAAFLLACPGVMANPLAVCWSRAWVLCQRWPTKHGAEQLNCWSFSPTGQDCKARLSLSVDRAAGPLGDCSLLRQAWMWQRDGGGISLLQIQRQSASLQTDGGIFGCLKAVELSAAARWVLEGAQQAGLHPRVAGCASDSRLRTAPCSPYNLPAGLPG